MKRILGKGIPREKKGKSVQINNLTWHSMVTQWQNSSIFHWTNGGLNQGGWPSRCPSMQHRARWVEYIGFWPPTSNHLMDVSNHSSNVHQMPTVTYTQSGCWILQFSEIPSHFVIGENIQRKPLALFPHNLWDDCCVLIRWRLYR